MRSIRSLVVVVATILAISGCGSPKATPTPFHLEKTCVQANGVCTVVSSDITLLPPGTEIHYTKVGDGSNKLLAATITVANGSTLGVCNFNYIPPPIAATCTFTTGAGALAGFHLDAKVSRNGEPADPKTVWTWVGTYSFGD